MSAKHTPGKWEIGFGDGVNGDRAAPSVYWDETDTAQLPIRVGKSVVCWLASSSGTVEQMMPDAYLIAAAPGLLDQLKDMAAQHRCGCGHPACRRCMDDKDCEEIIAQAEGRS